MASYLVDGVKVIFHALIATYLPAFIDWVLKTSLKIPSPLLISL